MSASNSGPQVLLAPPGAASGVMGALELAPVASGHLLSAAPGLSARTHVDHHSAAWGGSAESSNGGSGDDDRVAAGSDASLEAGQLLAALLLSGSGDRRPSSAHGVATEAAVGSTAQGNSSMPVCHTDYSAGSSAQLGRSAADERQLPLSGANGAAADDVLCDSYCHMGGGSSGGGSSQGGGELLPSGPVEAGLSGSLMVGASSSADVSQLGSESEEAQPQEQEPDEEQRGLSGNCRDWDSFCTAGSVGAAPAGFAAALPGACTSAAGAGAAGSSAPPLPRQLGRCSTASRIPSPPLLLFDSPAGAPTASAVHSATPSRAAPAEARAATRIPSPPHVTSPQMQAADWTIRAEHRRQQGSKAAKSPASTRAPTATPSYLRPTISSVRHLCARLQGSCCIDFV